MDLVELQLVGASEVPVDHLRAEAGVELRTPGKPTRQRLPYDHDLDSELLSALTIVLALSKIAPATIAAVRDVMVEQLRSKRCILRMRRPDGTLLEFEGPATPRTLDEVERAFNQLNPPKV